MNANSNSSSGFFGESGGLFLTLMFLVMGSALWWFSAQANNREAVHVERYQAWQAIIDQTNDRGQKDMLRYARSEVTRGSCGGEQEKNFMQGGKTVPSKKARYRSWVVAMERDCLAQLRGKILIEQDNTQLLTLLDRIPVR